MDKERNERIDNLVRVEYAKIMDKLRGSTIYRESIDNHLDDTYYLIVAAYGLGKFEEIESNIRNWNVMNDMLTLHHH